jgi:hypothetical protein
MSPNTRLGALVRVRLQSFLCKYYYSRMSKFHSSFSLDFFLAKFPEHISFISFCNQGWQEGATPSLSYSYSQLGVQISSVTLFQFSRPTSSCSCHWWRARKERACERGPRKAREGFPPVAGRVGHWRAVWSQSLHTNPPVLVPHMVPGSRAYMWVERQTHGPTNAKTTQKQSPHLFLSKSK